MMRGFGKEMDLLSELASFSTDGSSRSDIIILMIEGW